MQLLNYRQSDPQQCFARVWRISGDILLESAIAKVAEALTIPYEETQMKNLLQAGDVLPYVDILLQIVNALKGVSSRRYGAVGFKKPLGREALWSPSYFALSVGGAPLDVLKKYIQNQEKPSFQDGACIPLISVISSSFAA